MWHSKKKALLCLLLVGFNFIMFIVLLVLCCDMSYMHRTIILNSKAHLSSVSHLDYFYSRIVCRFGRCSGPTYANGVCKCFVEPLARLDIGGFFFLRCIIWLACPLALIHDRKKCM